MRAIGTLRSFAKTSTACAYTWSGASYLAKERRRRVQALPFIVGYHRVVEDFRRSSAGTIPSMLVTTAMLERHIDWLARRYSIVSLDEIGLHLESDSPFSKPAAAITFDDGYSDVYHHAFPLLKKKGIPAAVFIVTGLTETGRVPIFDRLYFQLRTLEEQGADPANTFIAALRSLGYGADPFTRLIASGREPFRLMTVVLNALPQKQVEAVLALIEERVPLWKEALEEMSPMTWDMVRAMHKAGITIGSHTVSHSLLPAETIETVRFEVMRSKRMLEANLGTAVNHFAYPDGRFNSAVIKAVKSAGYRFGYGICQARDQTFPLFTIPRKVLWERSCVNVLGRFSSSIMNCHALLAFDRLDRCEHDHGKGKF